MGIKPTHIWQRMFGKKKLKNEVDIEQELMEVMSKNIVLTKEEEKAVAVNCFSR